jgi:hypothetical protein
VRYVLITASSAAGTYGTVRFNWAVQRRPKLTVIRVGGATAPAIALKISSGRYETGLRVVQITLPAALHLRAASDVEVQTTAGRKLAHAAELRGRTLTITLHTAHSTLRVVLPTGRLRIGGSPGPLVSVAVLDSSGAQTTLRRAL